MALKFLNDGFFDGKVGIGTNSPSATLQVSGQVLISATAPFLDFVDTNSFTDPNDRFRIRAGGNQGLVQWYDNSANSLLTTMTFEPNGNVIVPNGNVGIGTDDPNAKLHVGPSTLVSGYTPTTTTLAVSDVVNGAELLLRGKSPRIWFDSTAAGNAEIYLDGTKLNILSDFPSAPGESRLYIKADGNVGIGTTTPTELLEVDGNIRLGDGGARDIIGPTNSSLRILANPNASTEGIIFSTDGGTSTEMFIQDGGNVGIGITSPTAKLHVKGGDIQTEDTTGSNGVLRIRSTLTGAPAYGYPNVGAGDAVIEGGGTTQRQPGVITLMNDDSSIVANQDLGVIQFVGKDLATNGYASSQIIGTSNTAAGTGNSGGGILKFLTSQGLAISEKMRIAADGKVGIGTTNPAAKLNIESSASTMLRVSATSDVLGEVGGIEFSQAGTRNASIRVNRTVADGRKMDMRFYTGSNSEAMRIREDGTIKVGADADSYLNIIPSDGTSAPLLQFLKSDAGNYYALQFIQGSIERGSIKYSGTGTTFNTSSDYRLKEDLKDFNGLEMVSNISVYDYKWKLEDSRSYGVMAHELESVLPDAVSGEKDAENMQGVDYSKIVPVLIKAIQELKAEIDILKTK